MGGIIIALSVANTLLTALNHPLLKEAFLSFAYGNRLKKLKGTVTTVKSLLLDAANKGELSHTILDYVEKLKDAVYDADDLFDELVTKAQRKQLFGDDDNIFEKVRHLLPSVKTSLRVKKLRLRLKDIADDHAKFGLSIDTKPHRKLRLETFSYVSAPTVVGRDDDARIVISMLLDSTKHVNFLTIVGIGGVGKSTLAKIVFDEEWIKSEFDLRLWVCVSDQDGAPLDLKDILVKILELLNCKRDSSSTIESLHVEYQLKVKGKRVLLVLDDVWSESTIELDRLKNLLMVDERSRIIATTRSMKMARIAGDGIHVLQGLSDYHSRQLFEMAAFGNGSKPIDFVEIVQKIVKMCSNIPLVIKVVGSLLYGQPIGKWQTFLTSGFAEFAKEENEIMSILKISYDNLDPSLKSCFAYCAIFPKDYDIEKEMIINLWDAQGYIVPFHKDQSIENAGEEYFSVLLQRCFFQDVNKNELGDVKSFKIHDLMHDLAQRVSGNENCVINSSMPHPEHKVRHIFVGNSISKPIDPSIVFNTANKSMIRTCLMFDIADRDELLTFEIPKNWGYLRALVLHYPSVRNPDTIGNLLHLRYLNLSHSRMEKLPDSIVNLYNLKTLDISYCYYLKEWPKEFSKLVNLTHLYRKCCFELKCMPVGMSKLSRLSRLTNFVVEDESASGMQHVGQLKDLRAIAMNLKGRLSIVFNRNFKSAEGYDWEGSCLEDAQHLTEVEIDFPSSLSSVLHVQDQEKGGKEEVVMEKMKPNPNLRSFILKHYSGEKIGRWGRARDNWATFFPNLVFIQFCYHLQELPVLSKLRHLKSLHLTWLQNLEYMEEEVTDSIGLEFSGSRSLDATFFPSLKSLELFSIENLKGWWRSSDSNKSHSEPAFPNLSSLIIVNCPSLVSFPPCLSLPKLDLRLNSTRLRIRTANGEHASSS